MTTETILGLFVGVFVLGVVNMLVDFSSDDDDNGPDSGLMQPVYQGSN